MKGSNSITVTYQLRNVMCCRAEKDLASNVTSVVKALFVNAPFRNAMYIDYLRSTSILLVISMQNLTPTLASESFITLSSSMLVRYEVISSWHQKGV